MSSIQTPANESHASTPPRAPDIAACLNGLSLTEAFRKFVLEDPEIFALGKTIVEREREHAEVFSDGQYPGPYIAYVWPLDISAGDLAFQFVRPIMFVIPGPPLPEASELIQRVSKALVDKLQSLRRMFINGDIVAYGTFVRTGSFGAINRLQWARRGLSIDVQSGDLHEETRSGSEAKWSGLALEAPAGLPIADVTLASNESRRALELPIANARSGEFHVNSTEHDGLRSGSPSAGERTPVRRTTPLHVSIEEAIADLWPDGIPAALALQTRDQKIIDWQKAHGLAVASSKTIRRYLAARGRARR
jgi:hypothetical protein